MQLPIDTLLPEIVQCIEVNTITILQAEPGAGKTTRVPPAVLRTTQRPVYVLEPRKMAARLAARRVAEELATALGKVVGYQVRFEKVGDRDTQLWFLTEGVLTNRLLSREKLPDNSVIVFDEFHERHLEADVALALLRRLSASRNDLRIVIMSATLEADKLSSELSNAPVIRAPGRVFPVSVQYSPPSSAPLEEQVFSACSKLASQTSGHILVFLPGSAEIRKAIRCCEALGRTLPARLLPLHGDLPIEEQDLAIKPSAERKIIFSTNIAESSVTIEGIGAVVDSGLVRILSHSPWSGFSTLQIEKVSRSSAVQRAGRAGRTGPGIAVRLYSESDFVRRPEAIAPEIVRADLSQLYLQLAASQLSFAQLPWVDAPPSLRVQAANNLLSLLQAVDGTGRITELGTDGSVSSASAAVAIVDRSRSSRCPRRGVSIGRSTF